MASILLFHHVLGLTPGVEALAEQLSAAGHRVRVPDLFDGRRFDDIPSGIAHLTNLTIPGLLARVDAVAEAADYLIGMSMGVLAAQYLAQTRPGVRGAVLLESFVPPENFGSWPKGLPAQIHGLERDPEFALSGDLDAARAFVASEPAAELFLYGGEGHLFMDRSLASWHPAHAETATLRMLAFLAR